MLRFYFLNQEEVYSDFQLQKLSDFIDFFKKLKNWIFLFTLIDIQIEDKSKNLNFIIKI